MSTDVVRYEEHVINLEPGDLFHGGSHPAMCSSTPKDVSAGCIYRLQKASNPQSQSTVGMRVSLCLLTFVITL